MAVIDPVALNRLPRLLSEAATHLGYAMNSMESTIDWEEWKGLIESLRQYAILVESVAQDG